MLVSSAGSPTVPTPGKTCSAPRSDHPRGVGPGAAGPILRRRRFRCSARRGWITPPRRHLNRRRRPAGSRPANRGLACRPRSRFGPEGLAPLPPNHRPPRLVVRIRASYTAANPHPFGDPLPWSGRAAVWAHWRSGTLPLPGPNCLRIVHLAPPMILPSHAHSCGYPPHRLDDCAPNPCLPVGSGDH